MGLLECVDWVGETPGPAWSSTSWRTAGDTWCVGWEDESEGSWYSGASEPAEGKGIVGIVKGRYLVGFLRERDGLGAEN